MTAGIAALLARAREGHRGALARLISVVERDGAGAQELAGMVGRAPTAAHIVGITGPPGAGKSTLVGALAAEWLAGGARPAVLAVDPSSPLTGGAILGDRVRMSLPEAVYVRSMATRGARGGLAAAVPGVLRLLDAVGFDPLVVETVGVGQAEVDIAATADTAVLVSAPGWGDAIQANKAGVLEVADVLVVNKADRPGAGELRRDLDQMLDLGHTTGLEARIGARPAVVMATALTGEGVERVAAAIAAHRERLDDSDRVARRGRRTEAEVAARAERLLADGLTAAFASEAGRRRLEAVGAGHITAAEAADAFVRELGSGG